MPAGCRVMCVRSQFDWKIQSINNFTSTTASFGAIQFDDGTTFTTTNVDGGSF